MYKNSIMVLLCAAVIVSAGFCADPPAVCVGIKAGGRQITVSPELYGVFYEAINTLVGFRSEDTG